MYTVCDGRGKRYHLVASEDAYLHSANAPMCPRLFQSGRTSLRTLMSLELGLQTLHSSSAYLYVLPLMPLQMGCTRSSLDLGQKGGSDEPKIVKNGQIKHVGEHTKNPLIMRAKNERDDNLCISPSKTCAWHCCMMHATPRKAMAPKMPQCGPV